MKLAFSFLMVYIMCLLTSNKLMNFDSKNYVSGIGSGIYYCQLYFLLFFCFTASLMCLCIESVNSGGGLFFFNIAAVKAYGIPIFPFVKVAQEEAMLKEG